MMIMKII